MQPWQVISPQEVEQIHQTTLRILGEVGIVLEHPGTRQILMDAFKKADKAAATGDVVGYRSTNAAFHHAILGLANNPRLVEMASELTVPIYQLQLSMLLNERELKAAAAGHRGR